MELKSKSQSTMKISLIIWAVCIILAIASIALFTVNYKKYSAGQQYAITSAKEAGINIVSSNNSRKENCKELYSYFTSKYYDVTIGDKSYDFSDVRSLMSKFKDDYAKQMEDAGYTTYDAYSIEGWFEYTNGASYFFAKYALHPLFIISYVVLIITIIWTVIAVKIKKKQIIVTEEAVTYRNGNSSVQRIPLSEITSAEATENKLKIKGSGFSISLSHIENAKELKETILHNISGQALEEIHSEEHDD